MCSPGAGVSLCTHGGTCHGCVQFVKSPCLRFYGAALAQPHVTAPTQIKCHLNILAAQHKREPIPSQEYHPLRWEWVTRFPYPHLPPSLSASGTEANEGPRLWGGPPPPSWGCQRCSATPAPLPTPSGHPFSDLSPRLRQAAMCVAPFPPPALPAAAGLHGAPIPSRALTKLRPETSPLPGRAVPAPVLPLRPAPCRPGRPGWAAQSAEPPPHRARPWGGGRPRGEPRSWWIRPWTAKNG